MTTARFDQTATRLADGRVLMAGGGSSETDFDVMDALAGAELYDPATGKFSATGSMRTARGNHTATLLLDGRVLIEGGSNDIYGTDLAQAEIYDPATGEFALTGTVGTVRSRAMAVLLHDGRVLIAGGFQPGWPPTPFASAELYDPTSGTFSPTSSMSTARRDATATPLPDGRVLVAGGFDSSRALDSAELYDPTTGEFSPAGSMTVARAGATAALLPDGRVLITGGFTYSTSSASLYLASADLYDPKTGKFTATGSMNCPRSGHVGTALLDGRAFVVGGFDGSNHLASAEVYDPKTGTFSLVGSMALGREPSTATLLSDGRVLIAGGFDPDDFHPVATAELYEP